MTITTHATATILTVTLKGELDASLAITLDALLHLAATEQKPLAW